MIQDTLNNVAGFALSLAGLFRVAAAGPCACWVCFVVKRLQLDMQKTTDFFREFVIYQLSVCLTLGKSGLHISVRECKLNTELLFNNP